MTDNGAQKAASTANSDYTGWETGAMNGYNNDINAYTSNVNSQIAAGDPFKSQAYKTDQNLQTSAAMNAANTKAAQQTRDEGKIIAAQRLHDQTPISASLARRMARSNGFIT